MSWDQSEMIKAIRWLAYKLARPDVPRLTPAAWASSCKSGTPRCAKCEMCDRDAAINREHVEGWDHVNVRPRSEDKTRWPDAATAVKWYTAQRSYGSHVKSATGSILDRARLGLADKSTMGTTNPFRATDRCDDIADIQICLDEAAARSHVTDESDASMRRLRRSITIEMVARGLVPSPRTASARLLESIEARRAELNRRK